MMGVERPSKKGFLNQFRELISGMESAEDVELRKTVRLQGNKVQVPASAAPMQILLGDDPGKKLFLYPESLFRADGSLVKTDSCLLFDPERHFNEISGFLRISPGQSLTLGRENADQASLLAYPEKVRKRHLDIRLSEGKLRFADHSIDGGTTLTALDAGDALHKLEQARRDKFDRLRRLLPGCVEKLEAGAALKLLESVTALMRSDAQQPRDDRGEPGGLVDLPDESKIVIVGDLHAKVDNLLVVLTQTQLLEELERASATLVIIGDAVHPDELEQEHEMDSSMQMMDLILGLKQQFPANVHYLRGNHDSFSKEIAKRGVPQGLLWEEALFKARGRDYLQAMKRYYALLPYAAVSRHIVTCHAGAPTAKISRDRLINIREHPKLEGQMVTIRLQKPNALSGYKGGDVKRLRKKLKLDPEVPFIVGHTPLSDDDTMWLNVGGIANHHILFGAYAEWVGFFVQIGRQSLPLRYRSEPLVAMLRNCQSLADAGGERSPT